MRASTLIAAITMASLGCADPTPPTVVQNVPPKVIEAVEGGDAQENATSNQEDQSREGDSTKQQVSGEPTQDKTHTDASQSSPSQSGASQTAENEPDNPPKSQPLFDGKSLDGWEQTNFGGEVECVVEDGLLVISQGYPMSGVTSTLEDLPTMDYEISLEAMKVEGIDFFCGLTFPVADSYCSLVVGGWAGTTVGFSCIDGDDASDNPTSIRRKFEKKQWYKIRLLVSEKSILAFIDDKLAINQKIEGKEVSLRGDIDPCTPLGICSFETRAHLRNIVLTRLTKEEIEKAKQAADQASTKEEAEPDNTADTKNETQQPELLEESENKTESPKDEKGGSGG